MPVKTVQPGRGIVTFRFLLLCSLLFSTSCSQTQVQFGIGGSTSSKPKKEISVYKIDYKVGLKIARQVCSEVFNNSMMTDDGGGLRVHHDEVYLGTAGAFIYPRLVKNSEDPTETGIMFMVEAFGEGYNFSTVPGYMAGKFFNRLTEVAAQEDLQIVRFKEYVILNDASISEKIDASIPTTFEGYREFLDDKANLHPFEGIWSLDDRAYTLGILYFPDDPRFEYKAFIISAEKGNWKPGEIKAAWNFLEVGDLCMGDWYSEGKMKASMVFQVGKKLIMSVNAPDEYEGQIALLKQYPTSTSQDLHRTGTGFAISEDGLIATAYHVVKDAKTVKVHLERDSFVSAKVVHSNPSNDLAVLRIDRSTPSFLQVAPMRSAKTGDRVFTVGFPVSSVLGDEPKYTEGVISSLTGARGAASFLQMTVPIQPGNSGGPLVNEKGEVVGIVTSTAAIRFFVEESGTLPQNVNWAVKVEYLSPMIELPRVEEEQRTREQNIAHVNKAVFLIEAD